MVAMNTPSFSWIEDGCNPKGQGERLKRFILPSKQNMLLSIIMKPDACGVSASNSMTPVASYTKLLYKIYIITTSPPKIHKFVIQKILYLQAHYSDQHLYQSIFHNIFLGKQTECGKVLIKKLRNCSWEI